MDKKLIKEVIDLINDHCPEEIGLERSVFCGNTNCFDCWDKVITEDCQKNNFDHR